MRKAATRMPLVLTLVTGTATAAMSLTSADLRPSTTIPIAHIYPRCGGDNISPDLSWSGAPAATMSFVLTMIDVDVKPARWSHWIVVNLPAAVNSLPRGATSLPDNAKSIVSNFGDAAYAGPCPPKGSGLHHYEFTIWAMPTAETSLSPDETATTIAAWLSKRALDRASLVGLVRAPLN